MNLDNLVQNGLKEFGIRFFLVSVIPTIFIILYILLLIWSGAPTSPLDFSKIEPHIDSSISSNEVVFLVIITLILSFLSHPFQRNLLQLYEGYWGDSRFGKWLKDKGIARQHKLYSRLLQKTEIFKSINEISDSEQAEMLRAGALLQIYFPSANRILPTQLGNVLRAAEDIPQINYGLDAVVIWPRLYPYISEKLLATIIDQRNQLDMLVRFSFTFFITSVITTLLLLQQGIWIFIAIVPFFLAWLLYKTAISVAIAYGISIQSAFDLHRFDLYHGLNLKTPNNRNDEKIANLALSRFLRQSIPTNFDYKNEHKEAISQIQQRSSDSNK